MSFIISSLGILIYIYILINEKYKSNNNDEHYGRKYKHLSEIHDEWEKSFVDIELERKIRIDISANEIKTYEIISPIICSLNGFPDSFNNHLEFFEFMRNFPNMIPRIYMGMHHKLLMSDALDGIRSPDVYSQDKIRLWKMHHEVMKWLNKQIQSSGCKYNMYFVKGDDLDKACKDFDVLIGINDVSEPIGGRYCWVTNLNNMPIS